MTNDDIAAKGKAMGYKFGRNEVSVIRSRAKTANGGPSKRRGRPRKSANSSSTAAFIAAVKAIGGAKRARELLDLAEALS